MTDDRERIGDVYSFANAAASPQEEQSNAEGPKLDRAIQGRIGEHLRAMYNEVLSQPIPDRFVELLARFEERGDKPAANGAAGEPRPPTTSSATEPKE